MITFANNSKSCTIFLYEIEDERNIQVIELKYVLYRLIINFTKRSINIYKNRSAIDIIVAAATNEINNNKRQKF